MAQISEFSSVFIFMDKKKSSCAFWNRKMKVQLSLEPSCAIGKGLDEIVKLLPPKREDEEEDKTYS